MERAKVLHLVSTFAVKTDTKWLVRLLAKVDRLAFPTAVGAFYEDGPISGQLRALGIETFNINCPRIWDLRSISRLVRRIREFDPQVVHTHLLRADLLGGLAGRLADRRVVSTAYAYGDFRRMYRRPWFDNLLDQLSTRFADRFIAVCESIRNDLVQRLGIDSNRVEVIHTGIDPVEIPAVAAEQMRQMLKIAPDEKTVLVAARLSYEKGIDCFLRAVKVLTDRGFKARYLIVGGGAMETELKELSQSLALSERVMFLGFSDKVEVLMKISSLVVMPSLSEGLPNVALEAFAVGVPLVASRVGGLIDLGRLDRQAIIYCRPNDPGDLADKIQETLANSSQTLRMVQAGRRIIDEHLAIEHVARRYERVYREITGSADSARRTGLSG